MPVSAHDIARELRERLPHAGDLKIHKLLYYCQGWHLTWTGEPMFVEDIAAWELGPVVADVWHDEKRRRDLPPPQPLLDQHLSVIDYVVDRYGQQSGAELKDRTHSEAPWLEARAGRPGTAGNAPITPAKLSVWFARDPDYLAHAAEVERLRARRDIYGFEGPAIPPSLREATVRALGIQPS